MHVKSRNIKTTTLKILMSSKPCWKNNENKSVEILFVEVQNQPSPDISLTLLQSTCSVQLFHQPYTLEAEARRSNIYYDNSIVISGWESSSQ